jgi:hypothetical protein
MPDNWGFVAAAYALAAIVLGAYWRMLVRKEREVNAVRTGAGNSKTGAGVRNDPTGRSRPESEPGHPRTEPASRAPLQQ